MFFCPSCHVSNRDNAKFCRRCGKPRAELEGQDKPISPPAPSAGDKPQLAVNEPLVSEKSQSALLEENLQSIATDEETPQPTAVDREISQSTPMEEEIVQFDDQAVVDSAPTLAVNIEQGESLTAPPDEASSPQCANCWRALRATDKFCCWCGEAQPNRVLPFLKFCLECNTFLPEKANYCYFCGTDVGHSSRKKVRVPHELFKDEESEFFPRYDA